MWKNTKEMYRERYFGAPKIVILHWAQKYIFLARHSCDHKISIYTHEYIFEIFRNI
jgi:hypothetical protein